MASGRRLGQTCTTTPRVILHKTQGDFDWGPDQARSSSISRMVPHHITILGAGLTGLSSALHLSRRFPSSHITLLEKQTRLGGWVRSERIPLSPNSDDITGSVIIEAGPRTLRPNSKSLLELVSTPTLN